MYTNGQVAAMAFLSFTAAQKLKALQGQSDGQLSVSIVIMTKRVRERGYINNLIVKKDSETNTFVCLDILLFLAPSSYCFQADRTPTGMDIIEYLEAK